MIYGAITFELGVRNTTALSANFYAADREITAAMQDVVDRGSALLVEITRQLVPVDTGFMRDHVKRWHGASALAFEVGWDAADFINAGLAFYPVFVELGTRKMAARPALGQAFQYVGPMIHEDARAVLRAAIERIGRNAR